MPNKVSSYSSLKLFSRNSIKRGLLQEYNIKRVGIESCLTRLLKPQALQYSRNNIKRGLLQRVQHKERTRVLQLLLLLVLLASLVFVVVAATAREEVISARAGFCFPN